LISSQISHVDTISEFYIQSPIKPTKLLMVCGERGDRFCWQLELKSHITDILVESCWIKFHHYTIWW